MKFTTAWADVARQNVSLKFAVLALSLVSVVFGVTTAILAMKPPLIIDRSRVSRVTDASATKHTEAEIVAFVKEAVAQRFNTKTEGSDALISLDQRLLRSKEQDELGKRGMSQTMIVNTVKVSEKSVTVDADRLISVGKVRSAFPFPLTLTLATVDRSDINPYGLALVDVEQVKEEALNAKSHQ